MTRAMRSLELDFKRRRRTAPWAGWVLLALAAAFTVDLGVSYSDARASLATAEARIARLAHGGGTMGIYSLAQGAPLKQGQFADRDRSLQEAPTYGEWRFFHEPALEAPVVTAK